MLNLFNFKHQDYNFKKRGEKKGEGKKKERKVLTDALSAGDPSAFLFRPGGSPFGRSTTGPASVAAAAAPAPYGLCWKGGKKKKKKKKKDMSMMHEFC